MTVTRRGASSIFSNCAGREATGLRAPRPAQFEEIEEAPRRVTVMANDVSALKDYITAALA